MRSQDTTGCRASSGRQPHAEGRGARLPLPGRRTCLHGLSASARRPRPAWAVRTTRTHRPALPRRPSGDGPGSGEHAPQSPSSLSSAIRFFFCRPQSASRLPLRVCRADATPEVCRDGLSSSDSTAPQRAPQPRGGPPAKPGTGTVRPAAPALRRSAAVPGCHRRADDPAVETPGRSGRQPRQPRRFPRRLPRRRGPRTQAVRGRGSAPDRRRPDDALRRTGQSVPGHGTPALRPLRRRPGRSGRVRALLQGSRWHLTAGSAARHVSHRDGNGLGDEHGAAGAVRRGSRTSTTSYVRPAIPSTSTPHSNT